MAKDNVARLQAGKVLDARSLRAKQKDKINKLSRAEVGKLIDIKRKVGPYDPGHHPRGRPWIL